MTSLNPLHTIEKQIGEALLIHKGITGKRAQVRILELLDLVGIDNAKTRLQSYPHELSGGQRQRVMIAMALANEPELLIADEPTTALDVTIQKQILELLQSLQQRLNMAVLIITHDLQIVRSIADSVLVMRDGEVVEYQDKESLFSAPKEAYTQTLLDAIPTGSLEPLQDAEPLLSAEDMHVEFAMKKNFWGKTTHSLHAVDSVSLEINKGETLAIVGESGSGKSTLAQAILQLNQNTGRVTFFGNQSLGKEISALQRSELQRSELQRSELQGQRSQLQMVFQDPFASLSPRMSVQDIIAEGLEVHNSELSQEEIACQIAEVLEKVGLDRESASRYPHQFSGGQRQRISIARALILRPQLIVLDEPTSALDRSVQKQILKLLLELQQEFSLSYLFISHDLSVVRAISHRVLVMQRGRIVEQGSTREIFEQPQQDYTKLLLSSALI